MPELPDFDDPRYLDEVGWFLHYDRYRRDEFGASYDEERLFNSQKLLEHALDFCELDEDWMAKSTVVTVGCGCTADLATWKAAAKVGVDPLAYAYQQLGMLMADAPGTVPTTFVSAGAEAIPLLDGVADLTFCRNVLDHIVDPASALAEIVRITAEDGLIFISVDIGGPATPDEPSVFSKESLRELVEQHLDVFAFAELDDPHSGHRDGRIEIAGRPRAPREPRLDPEAVLAEYLRRADWYDGG